MKSKLLLKNIIFELWDWDDKLLYCTIESDSIFISKEETFELYKVMRDYFEKGK